MTPAQFGRGAPLESTCRDPEQQHNTLPLFNESLIIHASQESGTPGEEDLSSTHTVVS